MQLKNIARLNCYISEVFHLEEKLIFLIKLLARLCNKYVEGVEFKPASHIYVYIIN